MLMAIPFCLAFAFICFAHGMEWWNNNMPTQANRIITSSLLTLFTGALYISHGHTYTNYIGLFILAGFALWVCPGWMSYIADAIGQGKNSKSCGLMEMTLRGCLILPLIAGLCYLTNHSYWPCLGALLLGFPYSLSPILLPKGRTSPYIVIAPHTVVGIIIGLMVWLSIP